MACISKTVECVAGDLLEYYFIIEDASTAAIQTAYFTCNGQGICVELPYWENEEWSTGGGYCLRLKSDTTYAFASGNFVYDLTVRLNDDTMVTVIHNGLFVVKAKLNPPCPE